MGNKIGVSGRRTSVAKLMVEATEELCEYKKIGTIEECRKAMDKQKLMKAVYDEEDDYVECPVCKSLTNAGNHPEEIKYCFNCGQALDGGRA